nr:MAG TPA: cytochrome c-552 [Caudoviricetes sp.]
MLGGCGVVVYSCTGGLYLYRVGHGLGFCSGCHIPVEEAFAPAVCAGGCDGRVYVGCAARGAKV